MDYLDSPTGTWEIRNDPDGNGTFLASRGNRLHDGLDLTCLPGQDIVSPIKGVYRRIVYPYNDRDFCGMRIVNTWSIVDLFYVEPTIIIGESVAKKHIIGRAQDISKRYSDKMKPHVHMRVTINPEILNEEALRRYVLRKFTCVLEGS